MTKYKKLADTVRGGCAAKDSSSTHGHKMNALDHAAPILGTYVRASPLVREKRRKAMLRGSGIRISTVQYMIRKGTAEEEQDGHH